MYKVHTLTRCSLIRSTTQVYLNCYHGYFVNTGHLKIILNLHGTKAISHSFGKVKKKNEHQPHVPGQFS